MSELGKIIGDAKSTLKGMLGRVAADETPLSHVDEAELEAEVEARRAAQVDQPSADANPLAELAGGSASARQKREQQATSRAKQVHAARESRLDAERKAQDAALRAAKAQAQRQNASWQSTSTSSTGRSAGSGLGGFGRDPKIVAYYKTLEVPYGGDFAEVKAAYRKLMRKYHPDLHNQSAKKQKAATELTVKLTEAYNALEKHLNKK